MRWEEKHFIFTLLLIFGITAGASAQGVFVNVPSLGLQPDPVAAGRGFTGVAVTEGASPFYNPALVIVNKGTRASFSRFKFLPGVNDHLHYEHFGICQRISPYGGLGVHLNYLNLASQPKIGPQGRRIGTLKSRGLSAGATYGRVAIPGRLFFGIQAALTSSTISGRGAVAYSFGVGVLWMAHSFKLLGLQSQPSIGFAVQNLGSRLSYSNSGYKSGLPAVMRLGVADKFSLDKAGINSVTISADVSKSLIRIGPGGAEPVLQSFVDSWQSYQYYNGRKPVTVDLIDQLRYGVGLQYWYNSFIGLRGGWYSEPRTAGGIRYLTGGASIRHDFIQLNISIAFQQRKVPINNIVRFGFQLYF
jgi:hypothetical protein